MANEQNTNARKRKKTGFRRKLSYGVAVLATLVLAFFLFTKSNVLAYQVSSYVNEHYLKNSPFEFSCGRITGDLVHHVVIRDPVLRYHSPTASFNVFRADEIVLDYKLLDVIKLNFVAEQLVLRNVRLQIRQDENGELVLPLQLDSAPQLSAPGVSPKVDVQRFQVAGLSLRFGGGERELGVRDVDLSGAFRYRDGVGRLEISEGRAFLTHSETRVSSVRLDVEHTAVDTGSLRDDMLINMLRLGRELEGSTWGAMVPQLVAAASTDPDMSDILRKGSDHYLSIDAEIIERAKERGEVATDID
ncbi:MAG: TetR/AcrR family transcriptional regulator C-terminal ligand-binding domain-containing protein, partial [Candidatus Krumholzibacteriota bacterium]|nr:TetR/AcrR family transcriptional regulator C-terminal ligand-binding domain-containing protein [Candidatus Krumholzibacteriota bacterium]